MCHCSRWQNSYSTALSFSFALCEVMYRGKYYGFLRPGAGLNDEQNIDVKKSGTASNGSHRRPCALFRATGRPNHEQRTMSASMLQAPYFWRSSFCSGWLVLIGVVQPVLWRAMPTAWPGRAHLAGKIQSVPRQKSFRDATKSKAKTTKHVHTGHQAASLNMYPS